MAPASIESESSAERGDMLVKHSHSFSEADRRSHIPMWDSADPERAPPPLPLNPGSNSPVTRPTASAPIQAAAAAIAEKTHESTPSSYTTNSMTSKPPSPEKSLIKGQYHKRMQSFQNHPSNSSLDFATYLERRSPEKKSRDERKSDIATDQIPEDKSSENKRPNSSSGSPSPAPRDNPRPSSRYLSKPILGEQTPPSAAMLALQNMQVPIDLDMPSSTKTLTKTPSKQDLPQLPPTPRDGDSISTQIDSLTRIATSLQHEMSQLSRRSKDNATDLVSLKAATNARDEDIRKSLKDLAGSLSSKLLEHDVPSPKQSPYIHPGTGALMIDNREHTSSPGSRKSYTLPRIPSSNTFGTTVDRDLTSSPAAISTDGSASIALLEKVMREMATQEGQEKLIKLVEDVKSRPAEKEADPTMSKMLEEILDLVKESSGSRALVRSTNPDQVQPSDRNLAVGVSPPGHMNRASSREPEQQGVEKSRAEPASRLNEDIMQILKRMKNSVAEGGGLTNEVKALVRELRGEVLGMGREIARKLEEAEANRSSAGQAPSGPGKEEIEYIVDNGLAELRQQMDHLIRESRRQQQQQQQHQQRETSPKPSEPQLCTEDVYHIVKQALDEVPLPEPPAPQVTGSGLERDEILDAVREAWETYKPEIELQNFGLERDEILECLGDGLKAYQPQIEQQSAGSGVTYEQVLDAMHHSLENWTPPPVEPDISGIREAVMAAVQDSFENLELPNPSEGATRDMVLSAVREGLATSTRQPPDPDAPPEDVFEAVRAGFHDASTALNSHVGEQVMEQFHDLATEMKDEFKQYSAAGGRDTEQVLDAIKDGLEVLRGEIESYVDRAADVTGKDEIIDTVKDGFGLLHADVEKCMTENSRGKNPDTVDLLDAMEKEFEHLRQTLTNMLISNSASGDKEEILDAIRDISESEQPRGAPTGNTDLEKTVKEEFDHLRETLSMTIMKPGSSVEKDEIIAAIKEGLDTTLDESSNRRKDGNESVISNTGELLDAFHDGVDMLRADMEKIMQNSAGSGSNNEILEGLKDGLSDVRSEIEKLREHRRAADDIQTTRGGEVMLPNESGIGSDIEGLKVLVTQLQIKVEAIGGQQPSTPENDSSAVKKEDLLEVLEAIKEVQGAVGEARTTDRSAAPEDAARKEDTDAIETLVRNTKAQLDEFMEAGEETKVSPERLEALEALAQETKDLFEGFTAHFESESPTKSDVTNVEGIMKDIWVALEELKTQHTSPDAEASEKVGKEDVKNLETLLFEMKSQLEEFVFPDPDTLATKEEITTLTTLVNEFKEKVEMESDMTAQAFESRKVEHGGLAEKIDEAKGFITEIREEIKGRLGDSDDSLLDLKTTLEDLNDTVTSSAKAESIKELSDLVTREFERSHGDREAAKIDAEERELNMLTKTEDGRTAAVADIVSKLEEKFSETIAKYEEAQELLESKFNTIEDRDMERLEALTTTKSLAEDIKLVIGGMGNSVSEACDRMGDDAKTFFDRVDESFGRVDGLHDDIKLQHDHVNSQFQKTLEATSRLETQMAGTHPEILSAIKEVVSLVGQHYEHSQKSAAEFKTDISAIPSAIPSLLPPATERSQPPPLPDIPVPEKYDDSQVQRKLDNLLDHATTAGQSFPHMEKLDRIQEQVAATARDVSEMMAAQSKSMAEIQESKQKEAQEMEVTLEKRQVQREKVEGEVVALSDERDGLAKEVKALKLEKEGLARENTEASKELARTETALRIRREEVEMMEKRAEGIERRIVEDVLDHARAMLVSRPTSGGTEAENTKRVPSSTSSASTVTHRSAATTSTVPDTGSAVSSGVGMALKRQLSSRVNAAESLLSSSKTPNRAKEKRILSHSHVTGNRKPSDRQTLPGNGNGSAGFGNLKRSQSVKANYALAPRKTSWEPRRSLANKENEIVKEEEEEDDGEEEGHRQEDAGGDDVLSDAGTERRTSFTGTIDSLSYVTGSEISSEISSALTDRKSSYGSTNALVSAYPASSIGPYTDDGASQTGTRSEVSIEHHDENDVETAAEENEQYDAQEGQAESAEPSELMPVEAPFAQMVRYGPPSDSGIGIDSHSPVEKKGQPA